MTGRELHSRPSDLLYHEVDGLPYFTSTVLLALSTTPNWQAYKSAILG